MRKLIEAGLAVVGGYAGWQWWKKRSAKGASYPLTTGQTYSVHLGYTGPGAGGAVSQAALQAAIGPSLIVLNDSAIDPTNKVITFLVTPVSNMTASAAMLESGFQNTAVYGNMSVLSVQAQGGTPTASA